MKSEKHTSRRYDDACAAAHALDLIGERWALLVVRELFFGPRRFGDLRAALPGISATTLVQRLDGLIASGIAERQRLPAPVSAQVYALTPWGQESEAIFQALGRWAVRSPAHDATLPFSAASLLLSLRTMIDPARARDFSATIGLRTGDETYRAVFADGALIVGRGPLEGVDVLLEGEARTIGGFIHGGEPLAALEAAGALTVTGDRDLAVRLPTLFASVEKAPSPVCGRGGRPIRAAARVPPTARRHRRVPDRGIRP